VRTVIAATGTRIAPFDDPPGRAPVLFATLEDYQREVLAWCGLPEPEQAEPGARLDAGPSLVLADDLLVGARLIRAFVRAAAASGRERAVLALEPCRFTEEFGALQDLPSTDGGAPIYPLFWLADGGEVPNDPTGFEPIVLPVREKLFRVPVPKQWFGRSELEVPLTARPALRIRHWLHLLFANRAAATEVARRPAGWRRAWTILWALLRAGVPTVSRVLRSLSVFGKGCVVHPTAVVEGSVLGPGARVGAHAVVRFSHVGAGALVMDGANVSFSTLGAGSSVSTNCSVALSLLYPEAGAAQPTMQLSVLGQGTLTTAGGYMMDMKRGGGGIRVRHGGSLVDSGQPFLGGAVGHGAFIGTGVWMAHGREIPNGYVIVRSPEQVLRRVPDDLPPGIPLAVRAGTLMRADGEG